MAGARQLAPRRGIGLIRVSKARGREDLISPELQDTAIRNYAQRKNIRLIDTVEALDESGSQEKSRWWRTLETVVARVEAGEADVVVVWKFSRAARHRRRWAITIDRIEVAGGSLESATEDVDTSTSTGRLTRGMLAELAAWEAEVRGEGWKEVKERRARLGLADGQPRFGYLIEDRTYHPDPITGPVVAECYRKALDGESMQTLALWLNAQGLLTPKGGPWRAQTLRLSMRNGFAAGLIRYKTELLPGEHEPLISREVFEEFQRKHAPRRGNSTSRRYLFSGLLRCGYCNSPLHVHRDGKVYRCVTHERLKACPGGGVTAWVPSVSRIISDWFATQVADQQQTYEQQVAEWRKRPKISVTPLRRQLVRIEQDLLDLAHKNLHGFYDDQTYLLLRADLLDKQRILSKQIEEVTADQPQLRDFKRVQELWDSEDLSDPERRQVLTEMLSHVRVYKAPDCPKYQPVSSWGDQH